MSQEHPLVSHSTPIRVRYADTDKMGIVYNSNYLIYFEVGRTELLRACQIPYSGLESEGIYLPVLEAKVRYLSPATYDNILDVRATVSAEPRHKIHIDYLITCNGVPVVDGYTVHAFISKEGFKPIRPPKIFWEAIRHYGISAKNESHAE